jgi:hypothetical protein
LLSEETVMLLSFLRAPVRLLGAAARAAVRLARIMMLAFAGLGPPPPRFVRHQDDVADVAEKDDARE